MPPKEIFTPSKVFIKPIGQPEAEWKELAGPLINNSITIPDDTPSLFHTRLRFTATVHISRKSHIRLLKLAGIMKHSFFTYKTIKRDCAKRNK